MSDVLLFLQEMEKRLNERLDQVENRLNKLDHKIDNVEIRLSEKINQVWTAVQELREEIDIHQQNKIEALSKRLFNTEADVVRVENSMQKLQERMNLLESKVS